jgi:redox-sensitive bicupin YhaK (pirin superfamily)
MPLVRLPRAEVHVIAGTSYGAKAPTGVLSPTLYAHARLDAGAELAIDEEHDERAVYVVSGAIGCDDRALEPGAMVVLRRGAHVTVRAETAADVMIIGGAPLDGARHIEWNFVASTKERIERAKADWREGRFPTVPGDALERIPLPE